MAASTKNFNFNSVISMMKPARTHKFAIPLFVLMGFFSGYVLAGYQQPQSEPQATEALNSMLQKDEVVKDAFSGANTKDITIVFTVDEGGMIHILDVSGGYNILTSYIRKSLEGRLLQSGNAVPGVNYVMTLRFPSSV